MISTPLVLAYANHRSRPRTIVAYQFSDYSGMSGGVTRIQAAVNWGFEVVYVVRYRPKASGPLTQTIVTTPAEAQYARSKRAACSLSAGQVVSNTQSFTFV